MSHATRIGETDVLTGPAPTSERSDRFRDLLDHAGTHYTHDDAHATTERRTPTRSARSTHPDELARANRRIRKDDDSSRHAHEAATHHAPRPVEHVDCTPHGTTTTPSSDAENTTETTAAGTGAVTATAVGPEPTVVDEAVAEIADGTATLDVGSDIAILADAASTTPDTTTPTDDTVADITTPTTTPDTTTPTDDTASVIAESGTAVSATRTDTPTEVATPFATSGDAAPTEALSSAAAPTPTGAQAPAQATRTTTTAAMARRLGTIATTPSTAHDEHAASPVGPLSPIDQRPAPVADLPSHDGWSSPASVTEALDAAVANATVTSSDTTTGTGHDASNARPGTSDPGTPVAALAATNQPVATRATFATAAANATTAARPADPAEQVLGALLPLRNRTDGTYTMQLELHPHDLGRVQLTIEMHKGVLSVHMQADRPEARAALAAHLDHLRDLLDGQGVRTRHLELAGHSGGNLSDAFRASADARDQRQTTSGRVTRPDAETMTDTDVHVTASPTPNRSTDSNRLDLQI